MRGEPLFRAPRPGAVLGLSSALALQTDFLMVVLRDVVQTYPEVRVVLMSATIDTTMFQDYFFNCPVIEVHGRTFEVQGRAAAAALSCDWLSVVWVACV